MKKTKFMSLESSKVGTKTVFKKLLSDKLNILLAISTPEDFDNVLYIGTDKDYGDVFKAWNNGEENNFTLYFGEKGSEFE